MTDEQKQKMKERSLNLLSLVKDIIKNPAKALESAGTVIGLLILYMALQTVRDLTKTGLHGNIEIGKYDSKGGFKLIHIDGKSIPPERNMSYMAGIEYDTSKTTKVTVGKKLISPGNIDLYGTGSISTNHKGDMKAGIGLFFTF